MIRIGFVDHDFVNYHSGKFLTLIRQNHAGEATVAGCWAPDAGKGRQWAEENDVPFAATPDELNPRVDAFVVLSPNAPEQHEPLCQAVVPFAKPTFVDKTFAPDRPTAERLFALADRHGTAMQSSSALRYTEVQRAAAELGGREAIRHMTAYSGGKSFATYAVHPLEMVVSVMGDDPCRLLRRGDDRHSQLLIDYPGGRSATVNLHCGSATAFAAALTSEERTVHVEVAPEPMFSEALAAMLAFLRSGRADVPRAETLAVASLLDAAGRETARREFLPI